MGSDAVGVALPGEDPALVEDDVTDLQCAIRDQTYVQLRDHEDILWTDCALIRVREDRLVGEPTAAEARLLVQDSCWHSRAIENVNVPIHHTHSAYRGIDVPHQKVDSGRSSLPLTDWDPHGTSTSLFGPRNETVCRPLGKSENVIRLKGVSRGPTDT